MAWAERRPDGTWRAGWRDHQGRLHRRSGFTTEASALRYAGSEETQARRSLAPGGKAPTWGVWSAAWLEQRRVQPSTAHGDRGRVNKYLAPRWADVRLDKITRRAVQQWVDQLADPDAPTPIAPSTVEKVVALLSASFTAAVRDERVPVVVNPCTGVKVPRSAPGKERYLTRAEVDAIVDHMGEPYRSMVLLLAGTGMRFGEAAGLHWQRVDLEQGRIDVVETWDSVDGRIKPYPKSARLRSVPIPTWLEPVLAVNASTATSCGLRHRHGGAACRSALVVTSQTGRPLDAHNMGQRAWAEACAASGVGHARLHDLRHSYASWLVQDGVPLQEVQRLLGHASITTSQRYAHLGGSQNDAVRRALG